MPQPNRRRNRDVREDLLHDLPVFPLPETVLFPHTNLQLHVFEPRYQALVADAVARQIPISVALIVDQGRTDTRGRPYLHEVAGLGRIVRHDELDDGRHSLLLKGMGRARIVEEHDTGAPFRRVRAQLIADRNAETTGAIRLLRTIQNTLFHVQSPEAGVIQTLYDAFRTEKDPGVVADILASVIFSDAIARQTILSEPDVIERLEMIQSRLAELITVAFVRKMRDEDVFIH